MARLLHEAAAASNLWSWQQAVFTGELGGWLLDAQWLKLLSLHRVQISPCQAANIRTRLLWLAGNIFLWDNITPSLPIVPPFLEEFARSR